MPWIRILIISVFIAPCCLSGKTIIDSYFVVTMDDNSVTYHAAQEFQKYAHVISGQLFEVSQNDLSSISEKKPKSIILLSLISDLPEKIEKPKNLPDADKDGFIIFSTELKSVPTLVIASHAARGVLFGVYEYFRQFCDADFYYDQDSIPTCPIKLKNIYLLDDPAFKYRVFDVIVGHNGLPSAHARYWQEKEWKHCIDWLLKNKVNVMSVVIGNPGVPTLGDVFEQAFPELKPEGKHDVGMYWDYPGSYRRKMMQEIFRYGRSRGLRFMYRYEYSAIPKELMEMYPELNSTMLDTDIPLQKDMLKHIGNTVLRLFGTDHLYSVQYAGENPSLKEETPQGVVKGANLLREIDPAAELVLNNTWHFLTLAYTPEDGQRYCAILKSANVGIMAELCTNYPLYKDYDYFYGMDWFYGVIPSLGMDSTFHVTPSFNYQIDNLKILLKNPKADKCIGYCVFPENFGGVAILYDFFAKVSWDPSRMNLDEYFEAYARRRYGAKPKHGLAFVEHWAKAAENVKMSHRDKSIPATDLMINFNPIRFGLDGLPNMIEPDASLKYPITAAQHLYNAVNIALNNETEGFVNSLYTQDLIDAYIQYLTQIFYLPLIDFSGAYSQFCMGGLSAEQATVIMRREKAKMELIVDCYTHILLTQPRFHLSELLKRFDAVQGINPTVYSVAKEKLASPYFIGCRNYCYEVAELVVRREVETILNYFIEQVSAGNKTPIVINDQELAKKLEPFLADFMAANMNFNQMPESNATKTVISDLERLDKELITPLDYDHLLSNPQNKYPMIFSKWDDTKPIVKKKDINKVKLLKFANSKNGVELKIDFESKIYNIPEFGPRRAYTWKLSNNSETKVSFSPTDVYFIEKDGQAYDIDGQKRQRQFADKPGTNRNIMKNRDEITGKSSTYSRALEKVRYFAADVFLIEGKQWATIRVGVANLEP